MPYQIDQKIREFFAVKKSNVFPSKNKDSSYLDLRLFDGQEEYQAKQWDYKDQAPPKEGTVIKVEAKVGTYKNQIQFTLIRWRYAEPGEYQPGQFIPRCPGDTSVMWKELISYIDCIKNYELQGFINTIIVENSEAFMSSPAALHHHHAYIGGLLEHSLSVLKRALSMAPVGANTDVLIAGAILHDIGKIQTYDYLGEAITMTTEGRLIDHIVIGLMMLAQYIPRFPNLNTDYKNAIIHMVESHHGKLEWGSPVEPCTLEALVLHYADVLDGNAWKIIQARNKKSEVDEWVPVTGMNRQFWVPNFPE